MKKVLDIIGLKSVTPFCFMSTLNIEVVLHAIIDFVRIDLD